MFLAFCSISSCLRSLRDGRSRTQSIYFVFVLNLFSDLVVIFLEDVMLKQKDRSCIAFLEPSSGPYTTR